VLEQEAPPVIPRASVVQVAVGYHSDDGTFRGTDRRSIQVTDETAEFSNGSAIYGSLGLAVPVGTRLRAGAALRYFGSYDYRLDEDDDEEVELGQLGELVFDGEWVLPVKARLDALVGGEFGLALLVPGGAFSREISDLRRQGAGVWDVPRLGYFVGPHVGGRYRLYERLFVRADLGVTWSQTFLFFTRAEVAGVDFEKTRRANVIRYRAGLAFEIGL
jgi:hypothetical protein